MFLKTCVPRTLLSVAIAVLMPLMAFSDYSFNGIQYSNPYNPNFLYPNGSPNLPPGYTGAYNPYINQGPGVTIINPGYGYAYPVVITSPGYTVLNRGGGRPCLNRSGGMGTQTKVQVHYDKPVMQMGPLFNSP